MTYWTMVFSSIMMACGAKDTDTSGGTGDTATESCDGVDCYGECLTPSEATYEFTLTAEEFATYLEEDGTLSAEGCSNICIDQTERMDSIGVEEVLSCIDEPVDGSALVRCEMMVQPYCEGRFHDGVPRPKQTKGNAIQQWFSRAAQSERSSVQSFVLLAQELRAHGAPQDLLHRLMKAAREEVHHARLMHQLCMQHRVQLPTMEGCVVPQRSLLDIAIENAVEGCVHERYAALQAHYQANHVRDRHLRMVFSRIAHEETEHTSMAEDLHLWLLSQLTQEEQEVVLQEKMNAQQALERSLLQREDIEELTVSLGLPRAEEACALAQELHRVAS